MVQEVGLAGWAGAADFAARSALSSAVRVVINCCRVLISEAVEEDALTRVVAVTVGVVGAVPKVWRKVEGEA
jgi:hypothetical protein